MITAEEARRRSTTVLSKEETEILTNIANRIEEAATNGEFEMFYYNYLNKRIHNELTKLGYTVTASFNRNEWLTKISW